MKETEARRLAFIRPSSPAILETSDYSDSISKRVSTPFSLQLTSIFLSNLAPIMLLHLHAGQSCYVNRLHRQANDFKKPCVALVAYLIHHILGLPESLRAFRDIRRFSGCESSSGPSLRGRPAVSPQHRFVTLCNSLVGICVHPREASAFESPAYNLELNFLILLRFTPSQGSDRLAVWPGRHVVRVFVLVGPWCA